MDLIGRYIVFDKKAIQEISKKSKAERWAFPKTFNALKEAGVEFYDVDVATHRITFHGAGQKLTEDSPAGFQILNVGHHFDANLVHKAIMKHQTEKTSYLDFLKDIANAGTVFYRVDMAKGAIIYKGKNPGEEHVEKVPQS